VSLFEGVNKATYEPPRAQQESRVTQFCATYPAIVQHAVGCHIDTMAPRPVNGRAFVHKLSEYVKKRAKEATMTVKVAISGFGRIGRNVLRAAAEAKRTDLQFVAINDLVPTKDNAHLFKYDSVHGTFPGEVKVSGDSIDVGLGAPIKVLAEKDPSKLPWKDLGVDIVMECTGIFTDKDKAQVHLAAGAKRVLVSAPSKGADLTVVYGVNHEKLTGDHKVVSNASCTTNCLAPVAKVLNDLVGIQSGYMTTIHSYTNDQRILDQAHKDMRRARAAALSMIPTSTGAAVAVGLVLPELKGKLDGTSIRVPTPNVSVIDLKFIPGRETTAEEINRAMQHAASQQLKGVLDYVTEELVSIDFNHSPFSSSFDSTQTQVVDGKLVRVMSWYDNEWGFSNRMLDTAVAMGKLL
jgi:glyceraldehyde 3-phosphate dehydrogenase